MRVMIHKAQRQPKRVVFPEGEEDKILRACQVLEDERIAFPILLGNVRTIRAKIETCASASRAPRSSTRLSSSAWPNTRSGFTNSGSGRRYAQRADELILNHNIFGAMMVRLEMPMHSSLA
jgi:malate dehydrogenase (oxaloacetate-decarboxylating)(NADP+)